MSASLAFREWATERLTDQLNRDDRLIDRLIEAVRRGLPFVSVYATPQPAVGTFARRHWETACDKCDVSQSVVFVVQPLRLPGIDGATHQLLFHAGLCQLCADHLAVLVDRAARILPTGSAFVSELAGQLRSPGDFTTLIGEPAEHLELALEQLAAQGGAR